MQFFQQVFRNFVFGGAVLEYNGGEPWYDVHPATLEIDEFQKALAQTGDGRSKAETPSD